MILITEKNGKQKKPIATSQRKATIATRITNQMSHIHKLPVRRKPCAHFHRLFAVEWERFVLDSVFSWNSLARIPLPPPHGGSACYASNELIKSRQFQMQTAFVWVSVVTMRWCTKHTVTGYDYIKCCTVRSTKVFAAVYSIDVRICSYICIYITHRVYQHIIKISQNVLCFMQLSQALWNRPRHTKKQ